MRELPPTAGLPLRISDLFGKSPADFSSALAHFIGVEHVGLACSGTASLIIALTALHRLSGRRTVIVPAYTCPLVALAILHCGLQIQLCDLAPGSFALDTAKLAKMCGRDTLAVIPTHLAGRVVDVEAVCRIAHAVNAHIIEDAAQALGARRGTESVGLTGDVGFFSLAVGKGLTVFEGGIRVVKDPELARAMDQVAAEFLHQDRCMEALRCLQLFAYGLVYRPALLGWVYGAPLRAALRRGDVADAVGDVFEPRIPLHDLGAWRQGVGARALQRLPDFLAAQRERASRRGVQLAALKGLHLMQDAPGSTGVWPSFQLILPNEGARDAALATLWEQGLGVTRLFAHALPDYAYLRALPGLSEGLQQAAPSDLEHARAFAARGLSVTNTHWLDDACFEHILATLERSIAAHA